MKNTPIESLTEEIKDLKTIIEEPIRYDSYNLRAKLKCPVHTRLEIGSLSSRAVELERQETSPK